MDRWGGVVHGKRYMGVEGWVSLAVVIKFVIKTFVLARLAVDIRPIALIRTEENSAMHQ